MTLNLVHVPWIFLVPISQSGSNFNLTLCSIGVMFDCPQSFLQPEIYVTCNQKPCLDFEQAFKWIHTNCLRQLLFLERWCPRLSLSPCPQFSQA